VTFRQVLGAGAAAVASVSAIAAFQQRQTRDYLTPELRAAVEKLKREPATRDNLAQRAMVLFDWINAYSLTGGPVPVNATQQLSPAFAIAAGETQDALTAGAAGIGRALDALVYEFRLKDERPGALPRVRLVNPGPFETGTWQSIEQVITTGEQPFVTGSTILIGKQFSSDSSPFQVGNPAGPGYVSIHTSRAGAVFEPTSMSLAGMHGGFRGAVDMPAFKLVKGTIEPGDTIRLVYGDKSRGSQGLRMQTFANDRVLLPVYVDPEAKGFPLTLEWTGYQVTGGPATGLRVIAPSVVRVNEPFTAGIRAEDRLLNRASGTVGPVEITINGQRLRSVAQVAGVAELDSITLPTPGTYRIQARTPDGRITAESNPIWAEASPQRRIYWGETHAHTGMAEGQGSIEGFYRYGREDARLDFIGLSEHDIWLDDNEWRQMENAVRRYTEPGKFVAFLGYEWTNLRPGGGHHNVFFRSPGRTRVPVAKAWNLSRLYQGLRSLYDTNDVLIIPHAHQAGDWRRNDPGMERLVEIMSMHGTFEWFGNYYLKLGHDVGFVAASDDHRTRPGLSGTTALGSLMQFGGLVAVTAGENTAPAVFDALRARSTYAASNSERILLEVTMNGEAANGRRLAMSAQRRIQARISGTQHLDAVHVIKNGGIVHARRFQSGAPLTDKVRVRIGFESDSEPYIRDNPRGYRTWRGVMEVAGARVTAVDGSGLDNRHTEFARLDPANPSRIHFATLTRGRADHIELSLESASPGTRIAIQLEAANETGVSPVSVRPMARIPASRVELDFSRLNGGWTELAVPVEQFKDRITLQVLDPNAPKDATFDYSDQDQPRPGDYYYVRVTQRDGSQAWSSPVWVGGESPR